MFTQARKLLVQSRKKHMRDQTESGVTFFCWGCTPILIAINHILCRCIIFYQWDATHNILSPVRLSQRKRHWIYDPLIIMAIFLNYIQPMYSYYGCLSGWSLWYQFFKSGENVCRFCMGLYAWFYLFRNKNKGGRTKGITSGAILRSTWGSFNNWKIKKMH